MKKFISLCLLTIGMMVSLARGQTVATVENKNTENKEIMNKPAVMPAEAPSATYTEVNQDFILKSVRDTSGSFIYIDRYIACYLVKNKIEIYSLDTGRVVDLANKFEIPIAKNDLNVFYLPLSRDKLQQLIEYEQNNL